MVTWLHAKAIHYWGDVDTTALPSSTSLQTLPACRSLLSGCRYPACLPQVSGDENSNPTTQPLHHLHETESTLYRLPAPTFGTGAASGAGTHLRCNHLQTALDQLWISAWSLAAMPDWQPTSGQDWKGRADYVLTGAGQAPL